jgi:mannose-1-phosphate guanylyltransferase
VKQLHVLIMAGGRGTRFWPRSRRAEPKQCVAVSGPRSMLRQTVDRLLPLIPAERILVVTGTEMEAAVRRELTDLPPSSILVEPRGRNTAPCIGWGAVEIGNRAGGDAVMAVVPADHDVQYPERLREVLLAAAEAASTTNALITLGVTPTRPETGFGYLEIGAVSGVWQKHSFHSVERFTEKPDAETAARYATSGRHLWNAGMFVFTVDSIRDAFRRHLPRSAEALAELQREPNRLPELWGQLDATSIDYGIMERSRHILTAPTDIGWSDVGSWDAAADLMPIVEGGRGLCRASVAIDAQNNVVHAPGKLVAMLGVQDLAVVDTPDVLLVMPRSRSQEVKLLLDRVEARGWLDYT